MKREILEKFGKISLGVHGKDFPKFSDPNHGDVRKEWWKYQNGYLHSPRNFSNKIMRQNSKLGGRPENSFICEATGRDVP